MLGNEFLQAVEDVIKTLDGKYIDILILCDVQGLSYEEAAKILNSNKNTIGTRLKRARYILYTILKKRGYTF